MATKTTDFASTIAAAYTTTGPAIDLGRGVHDGALAQEAVVQIPRARRSRPGLVAAQLRQLHTDVVAAVTV